MNCNSCCNNLELSKSVCTVCVCVFSHITQANITNINRYIYTSNLWRVNLFLHCSSSVKRDSCNAISLDYSRSVYFDWQSNACNERWRLSSDFDSMNYRLFFFAETRTVKYLPERFTATWYSMIQCNMKMFIVVNDIEVYEKGCSTCMQRLFEFFWTSGERRRKECTINSTSY